MRFCEEKGQITIFLCIILIAVIFFTGVLVDVARLAAAEAQVKRAAELAAVSVLSDYDSKLKNNYGIFALGYGGDRELEDTFEHYLKRNLMIEENREGINVDQKHINIYNYKIENINITPIFNLTENEVVRNQILEYMKYRAPVEIIEGIWEKLTAVKSAAKISGAYKKKTNVDKLLGKLDKLQQKLKKNISGIDGDRSPYVNMFNSDGARDRYVESYADLIMSYKSLLENIDVVNQNIIIIEEKIKNEIDKKEKQKLEKSLKDERKERTKLTADIEQIKRSISSIQSELYYRQTQIFINPNIEAEKVIDGIIEIGKEASQKISELEEYLDEEEEETDGLFSEFKAVCKEDIDKLKSLMLYGERAAILRNDIIKNQNLLEWALQNIDKINAAVGKQEFSSISRDTIVELLNRGLQEYNNKIQYDYSKPEKGSKKEDPRKGVYNIVKGFFGQNDESNKDLKEEGIILEELPSKKKVESKSFAVEDGEYLKDEEEKYADREEEIKYNGELGKLDEELDLFDEEGEFADNAFGFINSMGKVLSKGITEIRDELYINEYIMGTFKNSVKKLKVDNKEIVDLDLGGEDKAYRDTLFESEVEYILHGNPSEKINRIMTEGQILLLRFGLNTIHVYSDINKKEFANAIAAAVAGWWTGGAGIPIISNLIMCGWGMAEAVIDLNDLKGGEAVPFYKTKGDWKLDIGMDIPIEERKAGIELNFTYHDYLRLFLLLIKPDDKLNRLEDLIELNKAKTESSFKMWSVNTYIRVEAEVSLNYIFITQPFIPVNKKTNDGRHLIRVVLYEGY